MKFCQKIIKIMKFYRKKIDAARRLREQVERRRVLPAVPQARPEPEGQLPGVQGVPVERGQLAPRLLSRFADIETAAFSPKSLLHQCVLLSHV